MQVVKGDSNGYPVPGGRAGPTCPGVIIRWTGPPGWGFGDGPTNCHRKKKLGNPKEVKVRMGL